MLMKDILIITSGTSSNNKKFKPEKTPRTIKEICESRSISLLFKYQAHTRKQKKQRIKYAVKYNMNYYIEQRLRDTTKANEDGLSLREREFLVYYRHLYYNQDTFPIDEYVIPGGSYLLESVNSHYQKVQAQCKRGVVANIELQNESFLWGCSGNLETIKRINSVNARQVLEGACLYGHVEVIQYVLSSCQYNSTNSLAYLACKKKHGNKDKILAVFKEYNVPNIAVDELCGASLNGDLNWIMQLESKNKFTDKDWKLALGKACAGNHISVCKHILQEHLKQGIDTDDDIAFQVAKYGDLEMCFLFKDLDFGLVHLEHAVCHGNLETLTFMIEKKGIILMREEAEDLFWAASECGYLHIVKYLVGLGGYYTRNISGPFVSACKGNHFGIMNYLFPFINSEETIIGLLLESVEHHNSSAVQFIVQEDHYGWIQKQHLSYAMTMAKKRQDHTKIWSINWYEAKAVVLYLTHILEFRYSQDQE
jgi:hypothetical protein